MAISQLEKEALLELKKEGYTFTQAMAFIGGQRTNKETTVSKDFTQRAQEAEQQVAEEQSFLDRASDVVTTAGETVNDAIQGEGEFEGKSPLTRGVGAVASAASAVPQVALEAAPEPVRGVVDKAVEKIGQGMEWLTDTDRMTKSKVPGVAAFGNLAKDAVGRQEIDPETGATNFVENDLGVLEEGLEIASGTGEIAGNILAAQGTANVLTKGSKVATTASKKVSEGLNKIAESASELKGIKMPGAEGIKNAVDLGLAPEDLMQRVARISKGKQTAFEARAGESIGSYLVKRQIFGSPDAIVKQLWERFNKSKSTVDAGLASVKGTYKDPSLLRAIRELAEREGKVGGLGTKSPQTARIDELFKKMHQEGVTLTEANEIKRLYEAGVKLDYLRDNVSAGVEASNRVDQAMREFIVKKANEGGFKNVTALNRETMLARQLVDDLGAEYAGQLGNNAIGLSDTILLAESLGNPVAALALGLKKSLGGKQAQSAIAKMMSKGKGTDVNLPSSKVVQPDTEQLTGYLKFLDNQKN